MASSSTIQTVIFLFSYNNNMGILLIIPLPMGTLAIMIKINRILNIL